MRQELLAAFFVGLALLLLAVPAAAGDVDSAVFLIPTSPSEFYQGQMTEFSLVFYNFGNALDIYQITVFFPWGTMYDLRPDTAKLTIPRGGSYALTGTVAVSSAASLGTNIVRVQVHVKSPTDNLDNWLTYTDFITVEAPPALETLVVYASANPNSGNAPLNVDLHAIVFGGIPPYSYSWDLGDGGASSLQNPSHTYASAGTYIAKVTVIDSSYPTQTKSTSTIVDVTLLPLNLSASADVTSGKTPLAVNFAASVDGGLPPYVWSWNFGDGVTSSAQSPSHTYALAGTYVARVSVTDNAGQVISDSIRINAIAVSTTATGTFQVTLIFKKPDGSLLTDTSFYYGSFEGQETIFLGRTDSEGKIVSADSSLAGRTLHFKSSDGKYTARAEIPSSEGFLYLWLTEVVSPVPVEEEGSIVPLLIVFLVIGVVAVGGVVAFKKIKANQGSHPDA